jgi:Holliday junction DNA helicase RuvA
LYYSINGIVKKKAPTELVIQTGGVSYQIFVSLKTSEKVNVGENTEVLTYLNVREDDLSLFGFYSNSEKDLFKLLISVSGIGPKSAIGVLSSVEPEELQNYILTNNLIQLQKLPGVGKKTAERLVVELKDKIGKIYIESSELNVNFVANKNFVFDEAISALIALGYNKLLAEKSVSKAFKDVQNIESLTAEKLIKLSLKYVF